MSSIGFCYTFGELFYEQVEVKLSTVSRRTSMAALEDKAGLFANFSPTYIRGHAFKRFERLRWAR